MQRLNFLPPDRAVVSQYVFTLLHRVRSRDDCWIASHRQLTWRLSYGLSLFPPIVQCCYNLRPRPHHFTLPEKVDTNFISRILFRQLNFMLTSWHYQCLLSPCLLSLIAVCHSGFNKRIAYIYLHLVHRYHYFCKFCWVSAAGATFWKSLPRLTNTFQLSLTDQMVILHFQWITNLDDNHCRMLSAREAIHISWYSTT